MQTGLIIATSVCASWALIMTVLFARAKHLNSQIFQNQDTIVAWLKVHRAIERAGGAALQLKKLDESSIYIRDPS